MKKSLYLMLLAGLFSLASCSKDDNRNNTITPAAITGTVASGTWRVTYYYDSDHDETSAFSGYTFTFGSGGTLTAVKAGVTVTGSWSSGYDDSHTKLYLNFASPSQFSEISDDWHVIERSDSKIRLQDVSGGGGGTDYLTFERN